MRCTSCKKTVPKGVRYCPSCGTPVKKRRKWPFVLLVLLLVMAALATEALFAGLGGFSLGGGSHDADMQNAGSADDGTDAAAEEEVAEYEFDETVIEEITASTSPDVMTVAEAAAELESRGFADVTLEATYDLEGNLLDDTTLDAEADADGKYPVYNVYYTTESGNLWALRLYNGSLMADPLFAYDQFADVPILIIEDEHVTSYKATEDLYIVSDLAESELVTKHIDEITADVLESLSAEDIDAL